MIIIKVLTGLSMSETLVNKELTGEIHSVFNKTMNIINENNDIYTLATEEVFDGPQIIKVDTNSFNECQQHLGKKVFRQGQQLVIAKDMIVEFEEIEIIKSPRLKSKITAPEIMNQQIQNIDLFLKNKLDTVGYYRQSFPSEVEEIIHQFLISGSEMLTKAFEENDLTLMEEAIKKLLGLGHGLTPSGDDFLTGFSLIINSAEKINVASKQLFNKFLLKHINQTNIISQNQLKLSIEQEALHPVVDFINALYTNEELEEIKKQSHKVLSIGSSSGSDILYGVLRGVEVVLNDIEKNNLQEELASE